MAGIFYYYNSVLNRYKNEFKAVFIKINIRISIMADKTTK